MTYHSILTTKHNLRVDVGLSDDIEFRIEENYSLPDMLAEAIIWILTQEKENK